MEAHKRSVESTKQRILDAARVLFAEHGIGEVSIREIAKQAEISHSLIIRYFGSADGLATEILKREIEKYIEMATIRAGQSNADILKSMREVLMQYLTDPDKRITIQLIARAEMDGKHPELLVPKNSERLTGKLAAFFAANRKGTQLPDPKLAALVIMSSVFSLNILSAWLFSAIDTVPDQSKYEEVADILMGMIALFTGLPE